MINVGASVPSVPVKLIGQDGVTDVDATEVLSKGTVVFFTLPGAFTPTCHNNHVPEFIQLADEILATGVDRIICGTVNDHHVVNSWAASLGNPKSIDFLADGNGELARALDLGMDLSGGGLGFRFIRAAIILDNGVVRAAFAEESPGEVTSSGASAILSVLKG